MDTFLPCSSLETYPHLQQETRVWRAGKQSWSTVAHTRGSARVAGRLGKQRAAVTTPPPCSHAQVGDGLVAELDDACVVRDHDGVATVVDHLVGAKRRSREE